MFCSSFKKCPHLDFFFFYLFLCLAGGGSGDGRQGGVRRGGPGRGGDRRVRAAGRTGQRESDGRRGRSGFLLHPFVLELRLFCCLIPSFRSSLRLFMFLFLVLGSFFMSTIAAFPPIA